MSTLGYPRLHLRLTGSTNDRARELAAAGAPHGTLVTTEEQAAGRGRQGRSWCAPPRSSLLMSLLLRDPPALLPLIAAVATCEVAGRDARIKWPNDIVFAHADGLAKLAGILAESRPQERWAVLGLGMNVAVRLADLPPQLRAGAATLGLAFDQVEQVLARLLASLERWLVAPSAELLDAWRARDGLRGRQISWAAGEEGRAEGIDGAGRLIVIRGDGSRTALTAGEIHLRGGYSPA